MALRSLVEAVHRLSLGRTSSLTKLSSSVCVIDLPKTRVVPTMGSRSLLHTSCCQMRNLDNHAVPPYMHPSNKWGRWEPRKKISELYKYTTDPLPFPKLGGRGPNGRIWNHRRSGGHKRRFRMIDWDRGGPTQGPPLEEKVISVLYDPNRTARIALVAADTKKRYVIATEAMKAGDIIKSTRVLSKTAVRPNEGDSHPVGSLPIGTLVNNVEVYQGHGSLFARAAGVSAKLIRKVDDTCILKLPSNREISISASCIATIGRVSNTEHNRRVIGKAGRNRWLGRKPRSGRFHLKTGRFGRKIKGVKAVRTYDVNKMKAKPTVRRPFTVSW